MSLFPVYMKKDKDKELTTYQYNYLCFGEAGGEQLRNRENSSGDFLCGVMVIVGSHP